MQIQVYHYQILRRWRVIGDHFLIWDPLKY